MIILFSLGFFVLLFIIGLLWIFIPAIYGLPSVPTRQDRIRKALKLANLQSDEILNHLVAGDGRGLLIAGPGFNANAIGIESGPIHWTLFCLGTAATGFGNKILL